MQLSMKNKYLISNIILISMGMMISAGISYLILSGTLEKNIHSTIIQNSNFAITNINGWLEDKKSNIKGWARSNLYQTALKDTYMGRSARKAVNKQLPVLLKDYAGFEEIFITNEKGVVIASSDPETKDSVNYSDHEAFKQSIKGSIYVADPEYCKTHNFPVFIISAPVLEDSKPKGVFFCKILLEFFNAKFIDPIKPSDSGYAFMFDKKGRITAHPDKSNILKKNITSLEFGKKFIKNQEDIFTYKDKGIKKTAAMKKIVPMDWTIAVIAVDREIYAPVSRARFVNAVITVIAILVTVIITLILVNSTTKPLDEIVTGLTNSSEYISSASGQIKSSSQILSSGASSQAASIEETSSSLEQMSAMTRQNADNAIQADQLMKEAVLIIEKANKTAGELTKSITEIRDASEETFNIIKTIDEIAFQTNLLALNAAVEAARAGSGGAGFAVVAGEVRNLAMRASDAAKNTSVLIEGIVQKIKSGSEYVISNDKAFEDVASSTLKVNDLVSEIAAASSEQAQGIEQVNKAVADMDKIIQQNVLNADQTHSASEEMYKHAELLKDFVENLLTLIQGKHKP
ncbi:Methyl-accepting chemotaxis protein, CACHE domain-containing [Desulfonema limicola]|uniref:Methyl-accepting chemotaxis protein, CACHE domain-containing n=1 Tax=Desulfonema limicola TaxID=45656 RepID=A0A975B4E9_9BACT|nr:methyl-accepting chemotaxis protein [Desulfonema limicola]QTA78593.1 Methyl-accepting chemotaxis protein, CACHE domain-containing [Desulfonema limicola]